MCTVRANHLTDGTTLSCGCYFKEHNVLRKHGLFSKYERLYNIWAKMKQRCYNHNCKGYKDYGGRGITMCDNWIENYQNFIEWSITRALEIDS